MSVSLFSLVDGRRQRCWWSIFKIKKRKENEKQKYFLCFVVKWRVKSWEKSDAGKVRKSVESERENCQFSKLEWYVTPLNASSLPQVFFSIFTPVLNSYTNPFASSHDACRFWLHKCSDVTQCDDVIHRRGNKNLAVLNKPNYSFIWSEILVTCG